MKLRFGWQNETFVLIVDTDAGETTDRVELSAGEVAKVGEEIRRFSLRESRLVTIDDHVQEERPAGLPEIVHLLICQIEEALEIGMATCKALRFGLDDNFTDTSPRTMINRELNDLAGVVSMLAERGVIPRDHNPELVARKRAKLVEMMQYARQQGTLRLPQLPRRVA